MDLKKLLVGAGKMIKEKSKEMQEEKEKFENMSDDYLIRYYKSRSCSMLQNIAITSVLKERGYTYENKYWIKD